MSSATADDSPLQLSSSVDLLQNRARVINEQTLESTRRMVGVIDESKEVGVRTLVAMDEQGEKLNALDEVNREIRDEIRQSEKALTEMEKCCGIFVWPWKRAKSGSNEKAWKKNKAERVVNSQPQTVGEAKESLVFPRIMNDASEDEMESNLGHVLSTVGDLRTMAADMRDTARGHNQQLDKLILQAENNDDHVQAAVQRTDRLHR